MEQSKKKDSIPSRFLSFGVFWKAAGGVAIVIVVFNYFVPAGGTHTRAATFTVQRGRLPIRVTTGGSALSLRSYRVRSEVEGSVKILSIIEEGYRVTWGDIQNKLVLVELDSSEFKDRIMDFEIEYETALSQYSRAKQDYEVMAKENESIIQTAEREVKFKAMDLRKYLGEELANELLDELSVRWAAEKALEDVHRAAQVVQETVEEADNLMQEAMEAAPTQQTDSLLLPTALELIWTQNRGTTKDGSPGQKSQQGGKAEESGEEETPDKQSSSEPGGGAGIEDRSGGEKKPDGPTKLYGFLDEQRNAQELQEEAAAARAAAGAARDALGRVMPPFQTAVENAGLDPDAYTGAPLDWTLAFAPWDFLALSHDSRLGGAAALERERLGTDIMLDEEGLLMAKKSLDGTIKLFEKDFIAETDLEGERLSYTRKQIDLQMKQKSESLFMRYDFPKIAEETFAQYEEALRKLDQVQKTTVTRLEASHVDVVSAEKRLRYRDEAKKQNADQIEKYRILAKTEGLVVYAQRDWDEEPIREGLMVRRGMTLLTIPDITQMAVSTNIPESIIKKVQIGQRADIRIEAANEIVEGVVYRVGALPSNKSRHLNPDLKLYETVVSIKGVYEWLRPGMTAEIEIYVKDLENVLFVPLQAVTSNQGNRVCYLAPGDRRVVETGEFNEKYIEIKGGLREGDEVLLDLRPFQGEIDDGTERVEEDRDHVNEEPAPGEPRSAASETT